MFIFVISQIKNAEVYSITSFVLEKIGMNDYKCINRATYGITPNRFAGGECQQFMNDERYRPLISENSVYLSKFNTQFL